MPFSINVILQLHSWLYRYRQHLEANGKFQTIRSPKFIPTEEKEYGLPHPQPLKHLEQWMSSLANMPKALQDWNQEPLIIIPAVILDFLCIHPFQRW